MENTIYCFSGTGTAMNVSIKIQEEYPETEIVKIPESLSKCRKNSSKVIGLIFPIHALGLPRIMKQVINQINYENVEYIYAIATMGGEYGIAFQQVDKLLKRRGQILSASFALAFGGNSNLFLKIGIPPMLTDEVQQAKHEIAMNQIYSIIKTVKQKKTDFVPKVKGKNKMIASFANRFFIITLPKYDRYFRVNECIRCGKCAGNCPNQNITMNENGPKWNGNCEACLRCFNICSSNSILYGDMEDIRMNKKFTRYLNVIEKNSDSFFGENDK